MPRLKSRTTFPPGQFQCLISEVGMASPIIGSFYECVDAFSKIVKKNPGLAQKYGWPTDRTSQENFIDERECQRLIAHRWISFVDFTGPGTPTYIHPPEVKKNWRGAAAAVVNGGKAAFAAYKSMFGTNGPADRALAEIRAKICVGCKENDVSGGLASYFLEATASGITALLGVLKDLDVSTSVDDKLGVCTVCKCPTRAKCWVNLEIIKANTTAEMWPLFPDTCWLKKESGK